MNKLFLVDGSNLLFQMFYGMPARITAPDGRPVQGTMGFVGALLKMLRMLQPTHAAVFFDGEHEETRAALLPGYKANRPDYSALPHGETPFSQLADIRAALDLLGIAHAETVCCEADDWFAGYARALPADTSLVISSFDSDLFQLVDARVSLLRYRGSASQLFGPAEVQARFGVPPEQYAHYKALVGDRADNIPGVRGIGPKTAAALLRRYGSVQQLLACADALEKPSLRAALNAGAGQLCTALAVIELQGGQALPFSLAQMQYCSGEWRTREVLQAIGAL